MWKCLSLATALVSAMQGEVLAAAGDENGSGGRGAIFALLGLVVVVGIIVAIARSRRGMGRDEGDTRGPRAGDGAVVHHSSGEIDFDGESGTALPKRKNPEGDLPYPAERAAD